MTARAPAPTRRTGARSAPLTQPGARARPPRTSARPGAAVQALPTRARVERIRARLREVYGLPRMAPHGQPIAELVLTVLSQSTNDRNRDVAFLRLRERFPSWEAVRDAPLGAVEGAIRPGGISKVKSARIQAILHAISAAPRDARHGLSLDWMRDAPVAQSRAYLTALPGVGRKTAACVLLFSYALRDVPVDTHVGRVARRLHLLPARGSAEEIHDRMLTLTPPGAELELHVNLLRHGRRTCHALRPECPRCALVRMCPSRKLFVRGRAPVAQGRAPVARGRAPSRT